MSKRSATEEIKIKSAKKKKSARSSKVQKSSAPSAPPPPPLALHKRWEITPATPGAGALARLVNEHFELRCEVEQLFNVSTFLTKETWEKKARRISDGTEAIKYLKDIVMLGQTFMSTINEFPLRFKQTLEKAMFKEIEKEETLRGIPNLLGKIMMDLEKEDKGYIYNKRSLSNIYTGTGTLPAKYRKKLNEAAWNFDKTKWTLTDNKGDSSLTEKDVKVYVTFAGEVLDFMRKAVERVEAAGVHSKAVRKEYARYAQIALNRLPKEEKEDKK